MCLQFSFQGCFNTNFVPPKIIIEVSTLILGVMLHGIGSLLNECVQNKEVSLISCIESLLISITSIMRKLKKRFQ